jgi:hypothetical protein
MRKPVNAMKGKSFIKRIVPAIGFQVLKTENTVFADLNPSIGYRFTGKLTSGIGWNHRLSYQLHSQHLTTHNHLYGPRAYAQYSLKKGFYPRAEFDLMRTEVPASTLKSNDPNSYRWVPGVFVGIKKGYKITRRLRSTASVMVRVINPNNQSPYKDVVNARFGFEFVMDKGARKKTHKTVLK